MGPLAFGPQLLEPTGDKNSDLAEGAKLPWVTQLTFGFENGQILTMQPCLTFQECPQSPLHLDKVAAISVQARAFLCRFWAFLCKTVVSVQIMCTTLCSTPSIAHIQHPCEAPSMSVQTQVPLITWLTIQPLRPEPGMVQNRAFSGNTLDHEGPGRRRQNWLILKQFP
jgi:hypothetical protein